MGEDWDPEYGEDLEKFLLDSFYKPITKKGNLTKLAKRRLKHLGDFVYELKYNGKIAHDKYIATHPQEDQEDRKIQRDIKKKIKAADRAREKMERDAKHAADILEKKLEKEKRKAAENAERERLLNKHNEKLLKMGLKVRDKYLNTNDEQVEKGSCDVTICSVITKWEKRELERRKYNHRRKYGKRRTDVPPLPTIKDIRTNEVRRIKVGDRLLQYSRPNDYTILHKWLN